MGFNILFVESTNLLLDNKFQNLHKKCASRKQEENCISYSLFPALNCGRLCPSSPSPSLKSVWKGGEKGGPSLRWYLRCYVSGGLSGFLDKCCGGTAGIFTWHKDFLFLADARNWFFSDFELAIVFRQANTATIMPEGGDPQYTFLAFYCWKSICMCLWCWKNVSLAGNMYV